MKERTSKWHSHIIKYKYLSAYCTKCEREEVTFQRVQATYVNFWPNDSDRLGVIWNNFVMLGYENNLENIYKLEGNLWYFEVKKSFRHLVRIN